jgi:hypothetical protein
LVPHVLGLRAEVAQTRLNLTVTVLVALTKAKLVLALA